MLDIDEIGQVLSSIVAGAPLPKPRESPAQAPVDDDAGVATYDVLDRLAPKFSTNTAAARGELARLRAAELQCRRQELTVGIVATPGRRWPWRVAGPGNHVPARNWLIRPPRKHPLATSDRDIAGN